jgi:hypothetical protein
MPKKKPKPKKRGPKEERLKLPGGDWKANLARALRPAPAKAK